MNSILGYRLKASDDLMKYFEGVLESNINLSSEKMLRERLLLFWHSDEANNIIEIGKKFQPRLNLLHEEDKIKTYYLVKELNNCISHLKNYMLSIEQKAEEREQGRMKKEGLPPKHRRMSLSHKKNG